jgi:bla regulator protein blaR1
MNELIRCLFTLTLASSAALLAVLLIRRAVRSLFGASASYSTWLMVPAAMASVFLPHAPDAAPALTIPWVDLDFDSVSALTHALDKTLTPSRGNLFPIEFPRWVLGVWCAGAVVFAMCLTALQHAFVSSLGTLSGSRCVLRAEHGAACPAVLGVFRPRIVLPADFESRYSRLERLLVFSHERTHLRHGDTIWNALVAFLRCVFWFNPLIHLAAPFFRADQELACDAAVIRKHPGSRRTYASALLRTELAEAALPVGCHWQSVNQFKERLRMVKQLVPGTTRRRCGQGFAIVASGLAGYAAWAADPAAPQAGVVPEAQVLHLTGSLFARQIDDRRLLVGFSRSVYPGRDTDRIEHLFLFASSDPLDFQMNLDHSNATVDYQRATGLRVTFTAVPGPGPIRISCVTQHWSEACEPLAGLYLLPRGGAVVKAAESDGSATGPAHYSLHQALNVGEFWALRETNDCADKAPPCIHAAGQLLTFPRR